MIIRTTLRLGVMGGGRRGLSTGQVTLSRNSVHRMLVQQGGNQRKKSHMNFGLPRMDQSATVVVERGSEKMKKMPKNSSRLRTLNKVYLDKITDILSTGELASQLYGHSLELSEVCIQPNLQSINVYWVTTGNPELDQQTEALLKHHARTVRHELSNLRILGHSPPITFIRDDRHYKLQVVERLLAVADYGEDFEPTNPAHHLKAALPALTMPLDSRLKATIEGLERQNGQVKEDPPDPFEEALRIAASDPPQGEDVAEATVVLPCDLPTMRNDVLGVNTTKIYNVIQQSMKRARAQHRRQIEADLISSQDYNLQDYTSSVSTNRKREIQQWASRYKQMQRKEARGKNREAAMLSYPGNHDSQDLEEQEEIEMEWVEDDYNAEFD